MAITASSISQLSKPSAPHQPLPNAHPPSHTLVTLAHLSHDFHVERCFSRLQTYLHVVFILQYYAQQNPHKCNETNTNELYTNEPSARAINVKQWIAIVDSL
mmetsp:Transcript_7692/g.17118  ORF Transcript_7692/g.17118 Transcript_7692/m.17118 type:complete len:102 (+) Transcript_7692:50-355(+)